MADDHRLRHECLPKKHQIRLPVVGPSPGQCSIFNVRGYRLLTARRSCAASTIQRGIHSKFVPGFNPSRDRSRPHTRALARCGRGGLRPRLRGVRLRTYLYWERVNYGLAAGNSADAAQRATFCRSLHLSELALAHACVLGREAAWQRFLSLYRSPLTQAAIAITGSATIGHELADSLYAELYGLRELDGQRRSPLASYSGRGSLLGWLRTTLAQRHVDHHRRTRREAPLDSVDVPAAEISTPPASTELLRLSEAVRRSLQTLAPEDRFVLSAYFLDRQSLLGISQVIRVHEATVSRRLKRLVTDLRKQLIHNLQSGGLSKRASEEVWAPIRVILN